MVEYNYTLGAELISQERGGEKHYYLYDGFDSVRILTDEGDIDTTANHPFYVIGRGWVAAGDLVAGDEVYNLDGTTSVILASEIEKLDEPVLVYNLEVEDYHSYFVGCVPVLVHNYKDNNSGSPVKDVTEASNGLKFQSHTKHTPGGSGNRANAGIEPKNSLELLGESVATDNPNVRFAYDTNKKTLHRFSCSNGVWHWSGSTNQGKNSLKNNDVPTEIVRYFNINPKGW